MKRLTILILILTFNVVSTGCDAMGVLATPTATATMTSMPTLTPTQKPTKTPPTSTPAWSAGTTNPGASWPGEPT